jgi:hypothetical protein
MSVVSLAELKTYMDISLTNRQQDAADLVLAGLQSEMETYLKRPVEVREFTEEYRFDSNHVGIPTSSLFSTMNTSSFASSYHGYRVDNSTYLTPPMTVYLLNTPIVEVTSVKYTPIGGSETTLSEGTHYVVRKYGIDIYYGYADDLVEVTYDAGLDGPNIPVIKLLILRAATREMQNMHDDVVGVKDLETRNVAPMQTGFLDTELQMLRAFKRFRIS